MPRRWPEGAATRGSADVVARQVTTLVDTFVGSRRRDRLARTLVQLALEVEGVAGAAVVELREDDALEVVAFSDEDVRHLTDLQLERCGPALDATRTGRAALLEHHGGDPGWALLSPSADDLGLRYAYAIPLTRGRQTLGGLVIYGRHPPDVEGLRAHLETLAQVAAVGLLQGRMVRAANQRAEQLEGALTTRTVIEQAKGVLLVSGYRDPDAAFQALRGHARTHRLKLDEVARDVVRSAAGGSQSPVLPRQRVDEGGAAAGDAEPGQPRRGHRADPRSPLHGRPVPRH